MLEGPARIWLNNLPAGSIQCWSDFEDSFKSNFTSTYKRPNHPQHLAMCKQRENETDRDYLTRWTLTRNTCEGVNEAQAIGWFAEGCRHGSMLWQRLRRKTPETLAALIRIADSYALSDPSQPATYGPAPPCTDVHDAGPSRRQDRQDFRNKRNHDRPDYWYDHVAAIDDQPYAGNSQRQKNDRPCERSEMVNLEGG